GRLGDKPKYEIVRSSILKTLSNSPVRGRLGIISYGHRYKRNCEDVELLLAPTPLKEANVPALLRNLQPLGKTPIAGALELAEKTLGRNKNQGTIILVSDGIENCRRDPCQVAADLKKKRPGLRIQVLGLGIKAEEIGQLQCIARNTGGIFRNTNNQSELTAALSLSFASVGPRLVSKPRLRKPPPPKKTGIQLSALFTRTEKPVDDGIAWTIFNADPEQNPDAKIIKESDSSSPLVELPNGRYFVRARFGPIVQSREVAVDSGQLTNEVFRIRAGALRLQTLRIKGGEVLSDVTYRVYPLEFQTGQNIRPVAQLTGISATFRLSVGAYRIVAERDLARIERAVTIRPGDQIDLSLLLNEGTLSLSAKSRLDGPDLKNLYYSIFETDPDTYKATRIIARTAATNPSFDLPAGNYVVQVAHGEASSQSRVTVRPGKTTEKSMLVRSAELRLTSRISGQKNLISSDISYRVYDLNKAPERGGLEVLRTSRPEAIVQLNSGAYRVVSRLGRTNARSENTVLLQPGEQKSLEFLHRVGEISLQLVQGDTDRPLTGVFWSLRTLDNKEIWRTSLPAPKFILRSGRYRVIAEAKSQRLERQISVSTGDKKNVEFVLK
ncbi:MAG: vWA domain-containing protein, partial [Methyloligellaceae bacterium]